jgi:hypothetical protein
VIDPAEGWLLAASIAVSIGTVALTVRNLRDPVRVRDAQLTQNASPVTSLVVLVIGVLAVALVLVFGIALLAAGHGVAGCSMLCLAAGGVTLVAGTIWLRTRPFPSPGEDTAAAAVGPGPEPGEDPDDDAP